MSASREFPMQITVDTIDRLMLDVPERCLRSFHHGQAHWRAVAQMGWYLAEADPRVDLDVVLAFAALHDTRRVNEFDDPYHGSRAASRLSRDARFVAEVLDGRQLPLLVEALKIHNGSGPVADPTVGACLDADRLNLWRVGHEPNPDLLSTVYGRKPEVIAWARHLCAGYVPSHRVQPVPVRTWVELVGAYANLERRTGVRP